MAKHTPCPHCGGQLINWNNADTSCLQCGHIVYTRSPLGAALLGLSSDVKRDSEQEAPNLRNTRTPE